MGATHNVPQLEENPTESVNETGSFAHHNRPSTGRDTAPERTELMPSLNVTTAAA